ncbi:MAG: hypothetical protein QF441_11950 [Bacteriovoracaceae bacterium]|jgi:excinuclease ABC subunit A|nr:hypothetical protein [Bacteriovoracaceae bacterium]
MADFIKIRGARVHNLKNIDLDIPLNKLTCFFGPSGSGKTSLAFHTLYSESKRRFLNSFPTYLKFFSERPAPVDVDEIYPVLPVFGLPQINPVVGARSNVSDIMHLTELLQSHFYHNSKEQCPIHHEEFVPLEIQHYLNKNFKLNDEDIYHVFITSQSFIEFFSDQPFPSRSLKSTRSKKITDFDESHKLWEVHRFKKKHLNKLEQKLAPYLDLNIELYIFSPDSLKLQKIEFQRNKFICPIEGCIRESIGQKSPLIFSPYNPLGACTKCGGFGEVLDYDEDKLIDKNKSVKDGGVSLLNYKRFSGQKEELIKVLKKKKISITKPIAELGEDFRKILYEGEDYYGGFNAYFHYLERKKYKMNVRIFTRNIQKSSTCTDCKGTRLGAMISQFFYFDCSLNELMCLSVESIYEKLKNIKKTGLKREEKKSLNKMVYILKVAHDIGLGHLMLLRKTKSLSAGEYQRLLLLKYLSYEGTGALFVFDEPSLGLNKQEIQTLEKSFRDLIAKKNTVILIDHNQYFRENSDYLVEMGPGVGEKGGEILSQGKAHKKQQSQKEVLKLAPVKSKKKFLEIKEIRVHDKSFGNAKVILNNITVVTGRSGSGKSAVYLNTLANYLYYQNYESYLNLPKGSFKKISGVPQFNDVIIVDSNLNRFTSRSTVGSMTGLFPVVRKHFLKLTQAKSMGLKDGHLSYNSQLGQCPKCEGKGELIIEMQFLEDVKLTCEDCQGKKLKPIYAEITDGNMTVDESYSLPLSKVLDNIQLTPKFQRVYEYLKILNLDYLSLNRQVNSLSGGEKQRIYLLSKLQKNLSNSFLLFENLSFGLSEKELVKTAEFLQSLLDQNNTIVIIDQHPLFQSIAAYHYKME